MSNIPEAFRQAVEDRKNKELVDRMNASVKTDNNQLIRAGTGAKTEDEISQLGQSPTSGEDAIKMIFGGASPTASIEKDKNTKQLYNNMEGLYSGVQNNFNKQVEGLYSDEENISTNYSKLFGLNSDEKRFKDKGQKEITNDDYGSAIKEVEKSIQFSAKAEQLYDIIEAYKRVKTGAQTDYDVAVLNRYQQYEDAKKGIWGSVGSKVFNSMDLAGRYGLLDGLKDGAADIDQGELNEALTWLGSANGKIIVSQRIADYGLANDTQKISSQASAGLIQETEQLKNPFTTIGGFLPQPEIPMTNEIEAINSAVKNSLPKAMQVLYDSPVVSDGEEFASVLPEDSESNIMGILGDSNPELSVASQEPGVVNKLLKASYVKTFLGLNPDADAGAIKSIGWENIAAGMEDPKFYKEITDYNMPTYETFLARVMIDNNPGMTNKEARKVTRQVKSGDVEKARATMKQINGDIPDKDFQDGSNFDYEWDPTTESFVKRDLDGEGRVKKSAYSGLLGTVGGVYAGIRGTADLIYDLAGAIIEQVSPIDVVIKGKKLSPFGLTAANFKKNYPGIEKAIEVILPSEYMLGEAQKYSSTQYFDNNIFGYIKEGDMKNAGKLFGYQVIENLPQQVVLLLIAMATGNPTFGAAALSISSGGQQYHSVKDRTDMTTVDKYNTMIQYAAWEFIFEKYLGSVKILEKTMGPGKEVFKGGVMEGLWLATKNFGKAGVMGSGEEVGTIWGQNLTDMAAGVTPEGPFLERMFSGTFDAAALGFALEGPTGMVGTAHNIVKTKAVVNNIAKRLDNVTSENVMFILPTVNGLKKAVKNMADGKYKTLLNEKLEKVEAIAEKAGYAYIVEDGGERVVLTAMYKPLSTEENEEGFTEATGQDHQAFTTETENNISKANDVSGTPVELEAPDHSEISAGLVMDNARNKLEETNNMEEAQFITPEGDMLQEGEGATLEGAFDVDGQLIDNGRFEDDRTGTELAFMDMGGVMIDPVTGGVTIMRPMSEKQEKAVKKYFKTDQEKSVTIVDAQGNIISQTDYSANFKGAEILKDINSFYRAGKIPTSTLSEQDGVAKVKSDGENEVVETNELQAMEDMITDLEGVGAEVSEDGMVTVYHYTSKAQAKKIRETGEFKGQENGIFLTTKKGGEGAAIGDAVVKLEVPAYMLQLDEKFTDEAHLRLKTDKPGQAVNLSQNMQVDKVAKANYKNIDAGRFPALAATMDNGGIKMRYVNPKTGEVSTERKPGWKRQEEMANIPKSVVSEGGTALDVIAAAHDEQTKGEGLQNQNEDEFLQQLLDEIEEYESDEYQGETQTEQMRDKLGTKQALKQAEYRKLVRTAPPGTVTKEFELVRDDAAYGWHGEIDGVPFHIYRDTNYFSTGAWFNASDNGVSGVHPLGFSKEEAIASLQAKMVDESKQAQIEASNTIEDDIKRGSMTTKAEAELNADTGVDAETKLAGVTQIKNTDKPADMPAQAQVDDSIKETQDIESFKATNEEEGENTVETDLTQALAKTLNYTKEDMKDPAKKREVKDAISIRPDNAEEAIAQQRLYNNLLKKKGKLKITKELTLGERIRGKANDALSVAGAAVNGFARELVMAGERYEFNNGKISASFMGEVIPMLENIKSLRAQDPVIADAIERAMFSQNEQDAMDIAEKYVGEEMVENIIRARKALDLAYEYAKQVFPNLQRRSFYFPRYVRDYLGLKNELYSHLLREAGKTDAEISGINNMFEKQLETMIAQGKTIDDNRRALLYEQYINDQIFSRTQSAKGMRNTKSRVIDNMTPQMQPYYFPMAEAMEAYFKSLTKAVEARKFLSGVYYANKLDRASRRTGAYSEVMAEIEQEDREALIQEVFGDNDVPLTDNWDNAVAKTVIELTKHADFSEYQFERMEKYLYTLFNKKRMGPVSLGIANLTYLTTLSQIPKSGIRQLGDAGIAMFFNGAFTTGTSVFKMAVKKLGVDWVNKGMEQGRMIVKTDLEGILGELTVMESVAQAGGYDMSKVVKIGLKASGLNFMDTFFAGALIEGHADNITKLLKKTEFDLDKGTIKIQLGNRTFRTVPLDEESVTEHKNMRIYRAESMIREMQMSLGKGFAQTAEAMKRGDFKSNDAQFLLYQQLSKARPIGITNQPALKSTSAKLKTLYILKTFSIKLMDIWRQQIFREVKQGVETGNMAQFANGLANGAKLVTYFTLANASANFLIDVIMNRPLDPWQVVGDAALEVLGFNRWQLYMFDQQMKRGISPQEALIKVIAPPIFNMSIKAYTSMRRVVQGKSNFWQQPAWMMVPFVGAGYNAWLGESAIKYGRNPRLAIKYQKFLNRNKKKPTYQTRVKPRY